MHSVIAPYSSAELSTLPGIDTADAFASTGKEINNVIDNTDKMIAKLQINYKKYQETAAIPVAMEVAKTEYPDYGADVYIKDYD